MSQTLSEKEMCRRTDLRTLPVLDEKYENISHPYTNYSLGEAVALAVNHAKMFGHDSPQTLREVRDYIQGIQDRSDHQWLTGYAALDLLDASIDGRDLKGDCRLVLPARNAISDLPAA